MDTLRYRVRHPLFFLLAPRVVFSEEDGRIASAQVETLFFKPLPITLAKRTGSTLLFKHEIAGMDIDWLFSFHGPDEFQGLLDLPIGRLAFKGRRMP